MKENWKSLKKVSKLKKKTQHIDYDANEWHRMVLNRIAQTTRATLKFPAQFYFKMANYSMFKIEKLLWTD